jgi:ABC-type Mn2+/Zn2+ transport system ATPase subunit
MPDTPLIEVQDAAIGYAKIPMVHHIALSVARGDFLSLVGPNGAGKSTLLKTMLGIIPAVAGKVVRKPRLRLGFVPQRSRIDPLYPASTLEVVRQGGMGRGGARFGLRPSTAADARTALARMGIIPLAHRRYRDLSGGQQQRVLIARALVRNPELLVLDEPTEGLDLPSEKQILDFISALNREQELTVVLVAHKLSIIADRARQVVLINKDTEMFAYGEAGGILTDETLSSLYGYPMTTVRRGGRVIAVHAGEGHEEVAS